MGSWIDSVSVDAPEPDAIPVSHRFQADLPYLTAEYELDSDSVRFGGTRVLADGKEDDGLIGKGRPNQPCFCEFPGSFNCNKKHVWEEKNRLKLALGTAYQTWEFANVGQDVAELWTEEEEKKFRMVVKAHPKETGPRFINAALQELPSKSRKEILSYYFSVHVPWRLSEQRKLGLKKSETDDESEEVATKRPRKRSLATYLKG